MLGAKEVTTPTNSIEKYLLADGSSLIDAIPYCSIVGSL